MSGHAIPAGEPHPALRNRPLRAALLATRPPFLSVTAVGVLLGIASAAMHGASLHVGLAVATLMLALLAHAAINVWNDYCDAQNGADDANTGRLFPFTGGSRFIQNGVYTRAETARLAAWLLAAAVAGGIALSALVGARLLWVGVLGLLIGWAYSAPPLRLNSRGFGEATVTAGFLCVVIGADLVQRRVWSLAPIVVALPYALLVTNVLYINQFPDRDSDLAAGKRHWVTRLAPATAARGYVLLLLLAIVALGIAIAAGSLPLFSAWGALGFAPAALAARLLLHHAADPARLRPAIQATIAAALLHGSVLGVLLLAVRA